MSESIRRKGGGRRFPSFFIVCRGNLLILPQAAFYIYRGLHMLRDVCYNSEDKHNGI